MSSTHSIKPPGPATTVGVVHPVHQVGGGLERVGQARRAGALQPELAGGGHQCNPPNTGCAGSSTVTVKVAVLVTPKASTATQVTVLVPSGKVLPEGGVQVTGTLGWQRLVAVTLKVATAPPGPVASTTWLVAPRIVGGSVSGIGGPTEV